MPSVSRRGPRGREIELTPLVWFHASSVGEGLQAESVLLELRRPPPRGPVRLHPLQPLRRSRWRAGSRWTPRDYLPYDLARRRRRCWCAPSRPSLLVFSKLDLWPELATRAAARGASVAMVAATVSPGSGRLRWPARALSARGLSRGGRSRPRCPRTTPRGWPGSAWLRPHPRPRRPALRQRGRADLGDRARTSPCSGWAAARPRWWPAPPGRGTRPCCSRHSRRSARSPPGRAPDPGSPRAHRAAPRGGGGAPRRAPACRLRCG